MKLTAKELAEKIGARVEGDGALELTAVAAPERAGATHLIYVEAAKHAERAVASAAACVVAEEGIVLPGKTVLRSARAKVAFAKAAALLLERSPIASGVHATTIVGPLARLGKDVGIGPYAVIGEDVHIGDGTQIGAHCVIGAGCWIGENCRIHPRVTLYAGVRLGHRVEIHAGAVIGADGFGYAFDGERYWKFPQAGIVEIGDDAEIGANATIDRGSLDDTRIAEGVKLDNLVHVGHNVQIGAHYSDCGADGNFGVEPVGAPRGVRRAGGNRGPLHARGWFDCGGAGGNSDRARRFAAGRRCGVRRRGRWTSLKRRMLGLRGCRSWERGSKSWKRKAERRVRRGAAQVTETLETGSEMAITQPKEKILWRLIVVGGHTRCIGKTQLVCDVIRAFPRTDWIAGKVTQYGHGVCATNGENCDCAPTEHVCALDWETRADTGTDSARFLAAGAKRSFWLRTKQGYLAEGLPLLRKHWRRLRKR